MKTLLCFLSLVVALSAGQLEQKRIFHQLYGAPAAAVTEDSLLQSYDYNRETLPLEQYFDETYQGAAPTRARLITRNPRAWHARWKMIESAEKTIDMTYFIFDKDIFGYSMLGLLMQKAKSGVKIRLMLDARGAKALSEKKSEAILQALVDTGNVEVRVFNNVMKAIFQMPITLNFLNDLKHIIASNHDKIIVVDDKLVMVGGRNLSKDYMASREDNPKAYRDTDVLLEGPEVAARITRAFDEEFERLKNHQVEAGEEKSEMSMFLSLAFRGMRGWLSNGSVLKTSKNFSEKTMTDIVTINNMLKQYPSILGYAAFELYEGERPVPALILDKHSVTSGGELNEITPNIVAMMDQCQEEIIIQNPYVVLTKEATDALKRADKRGVKIIILTNSPNSSDSVATQAMFVKEWKGLVSDFKNLELWAIRDKEPLHAKVFVFDRSIAVVGTYNMDPMSQTINSEVVAVLKDRSFAQRTRLRIEQEMKKSIRYEVIRDRAGAITGEVGPEEYTESGKWRMLNILGTIFRGLRPLI